jgi:hypothetical protein
MVKQAKNIATSQNLKPITSQDKFLHWCTRYVDRTKPSYFKSKFNDKIVNWDQTQS